MQLYMKVDVVVEDLILEDVAEYSLEDARDIRGIVTVSRVYI